MALITAEHSKMEAILHHVLHPTSGTLRNSTGIEISDPLGSSNQYIIVEAKPFLSTPQKILGTPLELSTKLKYLTPCQKGRGRDKSDSNVV